MKTTNQTSSVALHKDAAHESFRKDVRLMTFGIHQGESADGRNTLSNQIALIAHWNADFVALQDVRKNSGHAEVEDQTATIAAACGMQACFAAAGSLNGKEVGVALLSRQRPHAISRFRLAGSERQGVVLIGEYADFAVAAVQLPDVEAGRMEAIGLMETEARRMGKPFLVAGLLGDVPGGNTLNRFEESFKILNDSFLPNAPADCPKKCASYAGFFAGNGFKCLTSLQQVVDAVGLSDHCPVVVEAKVADAASDLALDTEDTDETCTYTVPEKQEGLRLMSFNIRHGADMYLRMNLKRQTEVIRRWNPDFVLLQEVDKFCTRSGNVDEAGEMARALGMHATFGHAIDLGKGEYGVAVLSREKPIGVERIPLPNKTEARVLLICEFEDCYVACTHLSYDRGEHGEPVDLIQRAAARAHKPFFIGGDWNDEPGSDLLAAITERFSILNSDCSLSYPANAPTMCIDYLAAYNNLLLAKQPVVKMQQVADEPVASDHRPVVVDFCLEDKHAGVNRRLANAAERRLPKKQDQKRTTARNRKRNRCKAKALKAADRIL